MATRRRGPGFMPPERSPGEVAAALAALAAQTDDPPPRPRTRRPRPAAVEDVRDGPDASDTAPPVSDSRPSFPRLQDAPIDSSERSPSAPGRKPQQFPLPTTDPDAPTVVPEDAPIPTWLRISEGHHPKRGGWATIRRRSGAGTAGWLRAAFLIVAVVIVILIVVLVIGLGGGGAKSVPTHRSAGSSAPVSARAKPASSTARRPGAGSLPAQQPTHRVTHKAPKTAVRGHGRRSGKAHTKAAAHRPTRSRSRVRRSARGRVRRSARTSAAHR